LPPGYQETTTQSSSISSSSATINMHFNAPIALVAAAAAVVSASPIKARAEPTTLVVKQVQNLTSVKNLVTKGRAKIQKINNDKSEGNRLVSSGTVTNEDVTYVAPVSIGGKTWELIVDTGCK
jgi:hypothetical protein